MQEGKRAGSGLEGCDRQISPGETFAIQLRTRRLQMRSRPGSHFCHYGHAGPATVWLGDRRGEEANLGAAATTLSFALAALRSRPLHLTIGPASKFLTARNLMRACTLVGYRNPEAKNVAMRLGPVFLRNACFTYA